MTNGFAELVPASGSVPAGCGVWLFSSWMVPVCSQSKRATNCATPGYEIFQLWSNMGSTPVFDQFPARGKTPSVLASRRFPGFWGNAARAPASRSQSRRATNCATPRYEIVNLPGRFLPKQARYQLRYTRIFLFYRRAPADVADGREERAVRRGCPPGHALLYTLLL